MVELIKYIPLNMEFRDIIYDTSYLLDCIIYLEECKEFFTFYNIDVYNNTDFSKMFSRCIYSYMEQQFMYPKEYLLKKFNSPGVTHFGAIPINQIPNDVNSIKGSNVRGRYWTIADETGKEVSRDVEIDESKYTQLVPEFEQTYFIYSH